MLMFYLHRTSILVMATKAEGFYGLTLSALG
jgi:hypothetical protein